MSVVDFVLQLMPAPFGYSQSKSRPSRPYCATRPVISLTNAVRFALDATLVDQYAEPVQPPTETRALTLFLWAAATKDVKPGSPPELVRSKLPFCVVTLCGKACSAKT